MNKSFTLIEILVVIVVIGIISSFIIVGLSSVSDKANIAKGQAFSNSLRNSLLMNLVSEWKLDEGTGSTTLDSWGSNTGTLGTSTIGDAAEPTWTTDCVSGRCLSFDGTDDYITFGNSNLNILDNITISFWVNPLNYNFSVAAFICGNGVSSRYGYHVWLWTTGYLSYRTCQVGANQNTNSLIGYIPNNKFTHLTVTRSGTNATIYANGKDITESHGSHIDPTTSSSNIFVGRYVGGGYFLNGILDDMKIYKEAMSSFQVQQNYYSGINNLIAKKQINIEEYSKRIKQLVINN